MSTITDLLLLTPKGAIGGIEIQATLEEVLTDTLEVTNHPVELGAEITDHAYSRPAEVVLKCGWSNSSIGSLVSTVSALFNGGSLSMNDYITSVYSQLLALQQSRATFSITTSKRQYKNMLLTGLQTTTDNKTNSVLMVTATCREIIIVETSAMTIAAPDAQANPADTAETSDTGVKLATVATPSPGGSVPPVASSSFTGGGGSFGGTGSTGTFSAGASGGW